MKKITLFIVLFACAIFANAQNQEIPINLKYEFQNTLKLSPFELGRAEFQISYERYFNNRKTSLVVFPSIILKQRGEETINGTQLMLQYRFYLSQLNIANQYTLGMFNVGFYSAPYLLGIIAKEQSYYDYMDPKTFEYSFNLISEKTKGAEIGALMGIQLDITKRIVADFFVGGGIRKTAVTQETLLDFEKTYSVFDLGYSGVKPRIGFQIGITF